MNVGHEMIFASAGSGKTRALTDRFIRLLSLGVPPERIAALTFTRRAAGEFFGEIAGRLARASLQKRDAAELADAIGRKGTSREQFQRLLRSLVGSLHRLNLGTMDGFFAGIVRLFPLELGLGAEPGILDEHEASEETRRILKALFRTRRGPSREQRSLIEAFRLATFGTEGKSVAGRLDAFVRRHLDLYRKAPGSEKWGNRERIWDGAFPWKARRAAVIETEIRALRVWADTAEIGERQRQRWLDFLSAVAEWSPGSQLPDAISYVMGRVLPVIDELRKGGAEIQFDRKAQPLTKQASEAVDSIVRQIVGLEIGRRLEETAGIAAVLREFDRRYHDDVRRRGKLTFGDLQQLLLEQATEGRGSVFGSGLQYRMDGRIDHWLFDEFQDTSYLQWKILEDLVDEVVQDQSGTRSLFYVGDVKQAIFTWREGDPFLFRHLARRYGDAARGGIAVRELNDSWRSGPEVVAMVNRVFGDEGAMRDLFPEAEREWRLHWRDHRTARKERLGQAALLFGEDEPARWTAVRDLILEINPVARGLSCAILVRKNESGAKLADFLRREGGIAAVADADLHIGTDNPVATALAALLKLAVHPGDSLAAGQVAMSPLAEFLEGPSKTASSGAALLGEIQEQGFAAWFEGWSQRIESVLEDDDAFSRQRLGQLVQAAETFDASGSRDIDAFLRFLSDYSIREPEGASIVRVMTIHKAKGLGFDVVLLPDLEGQKLAKRREGPAVRKAEDRSIDWVLEYPGDLIASHDPVLESYRSEAIAENCYEQLSLLYVAMTRAKYATYAIVKPPGASRSLNFPRFLVRTLGEEEKSVDVGTRRFRGSWNEGNPGWFGSLKLSNEAAARPGEPVGIDEADGRKSRQARTPSDSGSRTVDGAALFEDRSGAEFGLQVHALLAEVGWLDPSDENQMKSLSGRWRERGNSDDLINAALGCISQPTLRDAWVEPDADSVLYRERAFEAVIDDDWISGRFDRLILRRDASGRALGATVFDFKTDSEVKSARERHGSQMELYRKAAARLFDLPLSAVTSEILLLRAPWRIAFGAGRDSGSRKRRI